MDDRGRRTPARSPHRPPEPRWRVIVAWGAIVAGVIAGLALALDRSGVFDIDVIDVRGNTQVSEREIVAAAGVPEGTSHLRLRVRAVAARVAVLPPVADVEVRRSGRNALLIDVDERSAVLQVDDGTSRVLVDRTGVVFATSDDSALPVVEMAAAAPRPGGHVDDDPALANAHAVWRGLSGPLRVETTRYVTSSPDDLELHLRDGTVVRFGRAERIDEKVRSLGAVLGDLGETDVEIVDVRAPSAPVVITGQ